MSKNEISLEDVGLLINKLMTESIPVIAFFVSREGVQVKFRGFVDSVTAEMGLHLATAKGSPEGSSYLSVPVGNPVGSGCRFVFGDKRELPEEKREEWVGKLGDSALTILLPFGARLSLFFTP
jgi:hypothetical protein